MLLDGAERDSQLGGKLIGTVYKRKLARTIHLYVYIGLARTVYIHRI